MASLFGYIPIFGPLIAGDPTPQSIDIAPVDVHHVDTNPDRRARCLKHLLKANHVNYSIVYHNLQYDNHLPHILSSAYLLGANEVQLHEIYDKQIVELEPWKSSPAEVIEEDWEEFLGDREYQRAYVDFFEDQLAMKFSYNWRSEMAHFLFSGKKPLLHGLIGGLGHPLIHLGYAYEMDCKELAIEGLGLACVQYNFFHKYLDNKSYTKKSPFSSQSPLQLLTKAAHDARFNSLPENPSFEKLETIFNDYEDVILEYWNAWEIEDPSTQFHMSQQAAVLLLVGTVQPGTHAFDFFLVHLLTTSHAVRILLPFIPGSHHMTLVREWWLLVLAVYIIRGRPIPDANNIEDDIKGRHWNYVQEKALNSEYAVDAHFVKAVRAMREAANTWGDTDQGFLKAALTFVDGFRGWVF